MPLVAMASPLLGSNSLGSADERPWRPSCARSHFLTFNVQMPGLSPPPLGGKLSASNSGGRGLRSGGIPLRGARGHGPEVSHGVDHEGPVSSVARGCRGGGSRADPSDLRGAGSDHYPGGGLAGSVATSGLRRQDGPSLARTGRGPTSCPATIRSNGASSNQHSSSGAFGGTCGMP